MLVAIPTGGHEHRLCLDGVQMNVLKVGLAVVCGALLLSCSDGDELTEVRVATDGAYPPASYQDENGNLVGWEVDMVNDVCSDAELRCTWQIVEWEGILEGLAEGEYDLVAASVSATEERAAMVDFSVLYQPPATSAYVVLAGTESIGTGPLAAQVGTIQADFLSDPVLYETPSGPVEAVIAGDVKGALLELDIARTFLADYPGQLSIIGPEVQLGEGAALAMRKGDAELKSRLDPALSAIIEDGRLDQYALQQGISQIWGNYKDSGSSQEDSEE